MYNITFLVIVLDPLPLDLNTILESHSQTNNTAKTPKADITFLKRNGNETIWTSTVKATNKTTTRILNR